MKLKFCPKCHESLPMTSFTSARAKYCMKCLIIRKLEQRNAMTVRSLERSKTKKQKTQVVAGVKQLKNTAQIVFNRYIRQRDKDLPCISCGKTMVSGWEAGHFWAQGMNGLIRYTEDNVHKQCASCNRWGHGNLLNYRLNLVKKIGSDRVDWLDNNHTGSKKWSREELESIISKYKSLTKDAA